MIKKMKPIIQWIDENTVKFSSMSDQIWSNPEIHWEEVFASKLLADYLEAGRDRDQSITVNPRCFALEVGGIPVESFKFPENGIVIIGNEELGVSPQLLKLADSSGGRTGIRMFGKKGSINAGVAFGILMHAWAHFLFTRS